MTEIEKTIRRTIKTTLSVRLMEGKTRRDVYNDFFKKR